MSQDHDIGGLMRAIEACLDSPEFKARLLSVLAKNGIYRPCKADLIYYRAETASRLLRQGMMRIEARRALSERFGVSQATAYRLIDLARDMQQGKLF